MSDLVIAAPPPASLDLNRYMRKTHNGRIKTAAKCKGNMAIRLTVVVLLSLTVYGFLTFNYKNVVLSEAIVGTFHNARAMFGSPKLTHISFASAMRGLLIVFSLGALSTITGAIIAFFGALLSAKNIANPTVGNVVKSVVAFIRAVPTILWVLIFTVAAGLGSVAAVAGLTFHSAGYLIKAYAETIEEMDSGVIEALKASGASYWQIVFQAIIPSSISYMTAWTFMRFEINFTNAVMVGALAGAGGIGFDLFMAGSFYHNLRELGFITYIIVAVVIVLELFATRVKAKVR